MTTDRQISSSRFGRLTQLGQLAGGLVGNMVGEGTKQLARGERPSMGDLLLTPGNMNKLANRLSEMRGAAMKVGQLISMDSGQLLPPQLTEVLARLREDAHPMPLGQVAEVLTQAWGEGWEKSFSRFFFTPMAAASIGQVHEALLRDGRRLAVKVQYPGIRRSIDSDVDNVATLLRLFRLLPEEFDVAALLDDAKRQLQAETNYRREASALTLYRDYLTGDDRFMLPEVIDSHTTAKVLAMSHIEGEPIVALSEQPAVRCNAAATALLELSLREVFDWGFVQTDPNFANYLYEPAGGRIALLDFGATRSYTPTQRASLITLLKASVGGSDKDIAKSAIEVGYLGEDDPSVYRGFVISLLRMVTEPLRAQGHYDFGKTDLAQRMSKTLIELRLCSRYGRIPPPDVLFLHRKLGGLYLLLSRLNASISVQQQVAPYL